MRLVRFTQKTVVEVEPGLGFAGGLFNAGETAGLPDPLAARLLAMRRCVLLPTEDEPMPDTETLPVIRAVHRPPMDTMRRGAGKTK